MFAGGALGAAAKLPEIAGAALAAFPSSVGSNVEASENYNGELTQPNALRALGYGVPEALLQGVLPGRIESGLAKGIATKEGAGVLTKVAQGAASGAATQIPVSIATDWLTQQMGDPNRSFADRAQEVVNDALLGGITGGLLGGATRPFMASREIAHTPPANVTDANLGAAVDGGLASPPPSPAFIPPVMRAARDNAVAQRQAAAQNAAQSTAEPAAPTPTFGGAQPEVPVFGKRQPAPEPAPLPEPPAAEPEPQFDWAARRKELQQAKAWSPLLKGRDFQSEDELQQAVFENVASRTQADKPVPAALDRLAKATGVFNEDGTFADKFKAPSEEPVGGEPATPEGVGGGPEAEGNPPGPVAAAPDRLDRGEIDPKNTGRWDRLEAVRNQLLKDDVSDPAVKSLLEQTAQAQNSIPDLSGKGVMKKFDGQIGKIEAQAAARTQQPEPVAPAVDKNAPAQSAQPSPQAAEFIAGLQAKQPAPEAPPAATPPLKQDQARKSASKRQTPSQEPLTAQSYVDAYLKGEGRGATQRDKALQQFAANSGDDIEKEFQRRAEEQTPKQKVTAEVNAAEPELAPKPGEVEAAAAQAVPREQGIENDARLYEQLQASEPADAEAAQQMREATTPEPAPAGETPATAAPKAAKPPLVSTDQRNRGLDPDRQTIEEAKRAKTMSDVVGKLKMIETSKRPVAPVPPIILKNIQAAKDHLTTLMSQGKLAGRFADAATDNQRFQDLLTDHSDRLAVYERAAKFGGMEAVREIPQDFFGTDLWDEMGDKVDRGTQKAMERHAGAEQNLVDMAKSSRGALALLNYDSPPTQHDMDLQNVVDSAKDINDPLRYIRQSGSTIEAKSMANTLLKHDLKSSISLSELGDYAGSRKLNEGEVIAGNYNLQTDHVNIFNGSGVEQTLLHEAIHAATVKAIRGTGEAGRAIRDLFERLKARSPDNAMYGLESPEEFVAEAGSNPQFQQFLRSEKVSTGSRISDGWQAFKNGVFKALGLSDRTRTLFDQVMDTTQRLMGENVAQAAVAGELPRIADRAVKTLNNMNQQRLAEGVRESDKLLEGLPSRLRTSAVQKVLGWLTTDHIAERLMRFIPAAKVFGDLQNHRGIRADTLSKVEVIANNGLHHLPKNAQDAFARVAARTIQGFDAFKTWEQQAKAIRENPQADILKEEHAKAVKDADILRRTPHGEQAYRTAVAASRFKQKLKEAYHFYDAYARNYEGEEWEGYGSDPLREYDVATKLHDSPQASLDWATSRVDQLKKGAEQKALEIDKEITAQQAKTKQVKGQPKPTLKAIQEAEANIRGLRGNRDELRGMIRDSVSADSRAAQGPYFHLGRYGDHFVHGHIIPGEDGFADDAAVQRLSDEMQKAGFGDAVIMRGIDNNSVYVRLNSETERGHLFDLFKKLEPELFDPKKTIERGLASDANIYRSVGPSWMRAAIEQIKQSTPIIPDGTSEEQAKTLRGAHAQQQQELMRSLMDMLPDTSLTKIYQRRMNVQGFNSNMIRNFQRSSIANSRGLSNLSLARELGRASKTMKDQMETLNGSTSISEGRLTTTSQFLTELANRNRDYQAHVPSTPLDFVRKLTHTISVGMSPAYVMMLLSQIPTLSLPELGKTHGYVASSKALAANTAKAFQVMNIVRKGDAASTFGIRESDLRAGGMSDKDVNFIMNLAARGAFNHGAYTDAMVGHTPEGGAISTALHYANSMSRYAEQFPRILTALAARDLHESAPQKAGGRDVHQFAYDAVNNSQFNWNQELNARQTTRSGSFGAFSPLVNQFMGYQTRMTQKLYKEVANGFGSETRGTEQGRQARTWLYGHLAAMTSLAGTLGLPLTAPLASVYDQLADWATNSDSHDITASYRGFLANTFGKEMGEVIARGAPRALGIDTDHFGEGSIVPGSRSIELLTEKRKWEDAQKDWLKGMAGSATGEVFDWVAAARDYYNGDYLDGMVKMLPEAMKKGAEAYRLGTRGFVDKNGAQLPISASATDVMMTAMGLDPAKEAEYDEAQKVATGLKNMRNIRSANIERHLQLAVNRGDPSMQSYWMQQAQDFQSDHPGLRNPAQSFQRQLMLHVRNAAIARSTGLPIGVLPRDQVGAGMTSFANLRSGEQ